MLNVQWAKESDGSWHLFEKVDLSTIKTAGVFVIWHEGRPPATVHVGHGDIAERIKELRADREVIMYEKLGTLRVTWATVEEAKRPGVERYVASRLQPVLGSGFRLSVPVAVNMPW